MESEIYLGNKRKIRSKENERKQEGTKEGRKEGDRELKERQRMGRKGRRIEGKEKKMMKIKN